jgi:energy-coupling factor transport system ATP-binding protein
MWAAAEYAHRVAVLAQGRVMLDAPTADVFAREDVLTPLALAPPPAAALANRLGIPALDTASLLLALGIGGPT